MLMLKLDDHGAIARYPYPLGDLMADHPSTSFPAPLNAADLAEFGVYPVLAVDPPGATLEQTVTEAAPELIDGVWTQQWALTPVSAEVLAQRQADAQAALVARFTAELEAHYDAKARERRYDTRYTCALRAGYAGPFQAEGAAFAQWMDACNAHAYTVLAQVQAGQRPMPASPQALIDELPALVWP